MEKSRNIIKKIWLSLISGIILLILFIVSVNYNFYNLFGGMPSLQDLEKPESELSSELYSGDNKLLGKYFRFNRSPVKFDELSDELVTTLLVTEDIRFYNVNENWVAEDRRKLLAFARDLLNSDYAGHRLTFQLFAQSPPFAHLNAVYNNFDFSGPLDFVRNAAGLSEKVMQKH